MNTISQILPPFLQDANPIITTTNRYVNIDGESMPVVKRMVNGSPKDLWFSKDNRFFDYNGVEYYTDYPLDEVTVTGIRPDPQIDTSSPMYKFRKRLYDNIAPYGYNAPMLRLSQALFNSNTGRPKYNDFREAAWGMYLGLADKDMKASKYDRFEFSPWRPAKGTPVGNVYRIKVDGIDPGSDPNNVLNDYTLYSMLKSKKQNYNTVDNFVKLMGTYTIGKGEDEHGKYISYYDDWDLAPFTQYGSDQSLGVGKPFTLYDRRYYTDEEAKAALKKYAAFPPLKEAYGQSSERYIRPEHYRRSYRQPH